MRKLTAKHAMSKPTKEQWLALEKGLFGSYGSAELRVDGYTLSLLKVLVGESKLEIAIYVDGHMRGEFITIDCEERRRFMRPIRSKVYTGSYRKRLEKLSNKRMRKELGIDIDEGSTRYMPFWTRFTPLRRHLARENESIEIVSINGQACDE